MIFFFIMKIDVRNEFDTQFLYNYVIYFPAFEQLLYELSEMDGLGLYLKSIFSTHSRRGIKNQFSISRGSVHFWPFFSFFLHAHLSSAFNTWRFCS